MKKIIKLRKKNQKILAHKRANAAMPKHLGRRPSLQDLVERTIRSDVIGGHTDDSLIPSKPTVSENPATLARQEAALTLMRIIPRTPRTPSSNITSRRCHVIPSDESNGNKTRDSSASSARLHLHRALSKTLCTLGHSSTTSSGGHSSCLLNHGPLRPLVVGPAPAARFKIGSRGATNKVTSCRPIPPPPRLPRLPIGFAYSSGRLQSTISKRY